MVQIWIDNRQIEITEGQTVLTAVRHLGIDVPAMCCRDGSPPSTSCLCCLVRIDGQRVVPSCATIVRDGMRVESETETIHELRRTGIELLLADHAGDCHAPCENTCPAKMDIPNMLRHVAEGDYRSAIETVKRDIALPAILGRVCPEVCEQACRRGQHDHPAAICKVKQFVADRDLESESPYRPPRATSTGRRVAVVGSGPTGLTAIFHLTQRGHHCTLIEQADEPGGRLRREFRDQLPATVLAQEAELALTAAERRFGQRLGLSITLADLQQEFDAVLLATGRDGPSALGGTDMTLTKSGIRVDAQSRMTTRKGVFAAGNAVRPYHLVVQSVAEGKLAAQCIDAWLRGLAMPERRPTFESRLARLSTGALCDFCEGYPSTPRLEDGLNAEEMTDEQARREAERCLECDCSALDSCLLHHYAALYHCDARRFQGSPRPFEGRIIGKRVVLESGKCILCGICVEITRQTADAIGLTFLGRSIDTRIGPPLGRTLDEALGSAAVPCAAACPTGAFTLKSS